MTSNVLDSCCQMEIPYEFLNIHTHPTPADLGRNMSKELVDIYLKTCTPIERVLFGRDKPLKGPSKLWINPADHSGGNMIRLTPIRTESVQALTHHGILEIGKKIEEKIQADNEKAIAKAVADAEGLAKFEADQRIKFHVENETKKLNEEWQRRMEELTLQNEAEKSCLRKIYEEGRELLSKFIMEKCSKESEELMGKMLAEVRVEMEKKCSETVDRELAQQSVLFEEQLQNTLSNLEANDKDRMEEMKSQCLVAMDLQSHLLICQKVTEMIHMMTMERKRWRMKLTDVKRENERIVGTIDKKRRVAKESTLDDQSKSIKTSTTEMLQQLDGVDVRIFTDEKRNFQEIHHQNHDDVMIEAAQQKLCDLDEVLIIRQPSVTQDKLMSDDASVDWIDRKHNVDCKGKHLFPSSVSWNKLDTYSEPFQQSFTSSIFQRFSQPNASMQSSSPEKLASRIIKMVKETSDERQLQRNVASIITSVKSVEKLPTFDRHSPIVTLVPMPKPEGVDIKDSLETLEKRVSTRDEPYENHQILAVVDSLELVNDSVSRVASTEASKATSLNEEQEDSNEFTPSVVPSKINIVTNSCISSTCNVPYTKMTDDDWEKIKEVHKAKKDREQSRRLSVQFEENSSPRISSRKSSITKRSSTSSGNQQENALEPIYRKCFEAMSKKSVGSVLMMLCEDDRRD